MEQSTERPGGAWAEHVARWGTGALVSLSFWTSFTHLADVARRSGVPRGQAWVWPSMIDGAALIATMAALTMAQNRAGRRYAWGVVWANLSLSLAGNVGSVLMAEGPMPLGVRVVVACIPPIELMVCLHLALIQTGRRLADVQVEHRRPHHAPVDVPVHPVAVRGAVHGVEVERVTSEGLERGPVHEVPADPPAVETAPGWSDVPLFDVAAAEGRTPAQVTATVPDDAREPARGPGGEEAQRVTRFTEWVRTVRAVHGPDRPTWAEAGEYLGASKATGGRWLAKHGAPDQSADAELGGPPVHVDEGQDHDDAAVFGAYERMNA